MNENELQRALDMKQRLNDVGSGYCLAKWDQVTMHLHNGMTHSCHHPAPHKISVEEVESNYMAIHNSEEKLNQRAAMIRGERPEPCNYCYKMEDNNENAISDRYLKSANLFADRFDTIRSSGLGESHAPNYVEVSFSNACNLKCSYCGPHFSSKWQQEQEAHERITLVDVKKGTRSWNYHDLEWYKSIDQLPIPQREYNPYVEAFWKWWPELKNSIKYLRITGGEPLMSRDTFKLMQDLEQDPRPELDFALNTNLNAPEAAWQKLLDFIKRNEDHNCVKKITLYTSIDGWGEQAEYIRNGLDFNLLWDRLMYLIENHPQVDNTIMVTYSLMSIPSFKTFLQRVLEVKQRYNRYNGSMIGRYNQYVEFMKSTDQGDWFVRGEKPCSLHIDISPLHFPPFMSVGTPDKAWTMPRVWDQYEFMMSNLTVGEDNRNFYDFEAEKMGRVVDNAFYAGYEYDRFEEESIMHRANFARYIDILDQRRGTDFCSVFPEYEDMFRKGLEDASRL